MVGLIYKDELLCHEYDQGHFPLYDHGLGNHYDIGFDPDHLQDIDTSKGFDWMMFMMMMKITMIIMMVILILLGHYNNKMKMSGQLIW